MHSHKMFFKIFNVFIASRFGLMKPQLQRFISCTSLGGTSSMDSIGRHWQSEDHEDDADDIGYDIEDLEARGWHGHFAFVSCA